MNLFTVKKDKTVEETGQANEVPTDHKNSPNLSAEIQICQPLSPEKDHLSPLNSELLPSSFHDSGPTIEPVVDISSEVVKITNSPEPSPNCDDMHEENVQSYDNKSLGSVTSSESKTSDIVSLQLKKDVSSENISNIETPLSCDVTPESESNPVLTKSEVVDSNEPKTEEVVTKILYESNSEKLENILRNFDGNDSEKPKNENVENKNEEEIKQKHQSQANSSQHLSIAPHDKLSMLIEKTELEFTRSLSGHRSSGSFSDGPMANEAGGNSAPESERSLYKSPSSTSTLHKTPDSSSSGEDFYRKYRGESACSSLVSSPDNPLMSLYESDEDEGKPSRYLKDATAAVEEPNTECCNLPPYKFINNWIEHATLGNLYSISLSDTHVWITDKSQNIYYSFMHGPGLTWRKAAGMAKQIAVSKSGQIIWRLHKNFAYAGTKMTAKRPEGMKWVEAVRDCNYIALDDNCAW